MLIFIVAFSFKLKFGFIEEFKGPNLGLVRVYINDPWFLF
ncbi:hypothetical protein MC7420_4842 [Coleofasciculus chthonoplastes PCC 7420]|uniref:Uncharacterized protein n=1 Tax=Coleofasciculus chthonoplastes PCC 7420 TaxID=118168 RepID=B4VNP3_9CYAN|nr:hypothetical protein MC7420_4842 [Coleofasciculus chthonoplastes PCC 7420]